MTREQLCFLIHARLSFCSCTCDGKSWSLLLIDTQLGASFGFDLLRLSLRHCTRLFPFSVLKTLYEGPNKNKGTYIFLASFSGSICATSSFVFQAGTGPECGKWPQGRVGRSAPARAQHLKGGRSCLAAGGAGEEESHKCCRSEFLDLWMLKKIFMYFKYICKYYKH